MSSLEKNKLAMIVKVSNPTIKFGEVVVTAQDMPTGSEINDGRFGHQVAPNKGYWWVYNRHGNWLEHESNMVKLHDGDGLDEMVKIVGKPPSLLTA